MDHGQLDIPLGTARQQPEWGDAAEVQCVLRELRARPALVAAEDVRALRTSLGEVAAGKAQVVQAGDCAEDPAECTSGYVARKAGLLDVLAGFMKMNTHKQVVRAGRIAGQYGKPRSKPTEWAGDIELPVYRGHMVNCSEPDPSGRQPDPWRLLSGYHAARETMGHLGWHGTGTMPRFDSPVWTSHEALLLDFEIPMLRRDGQGSLVLTSTHWPWIGDRTRDVDGAHVALLAEVINPVACKVGPNMTVDELLALCARLDPRCEPGRLTLISRQGAEAIPELLSPLVTAVRDAGHPVIWLTDPMHGNTVTTSEGVKTRFLDTIKSEIQVFQRTVRDAGGYPGGLHLETTPDDVVECVSDSAAIEQVGDKYTSLCDPRLNPHQAISVLSAWSG